MEWISVLDDLPPIGKKVLVHDRSNGQVKQASRNRGCCTMSWEVGEWGDPFYLHWMPFPEPPKD